MKIGVRKERKKERNKETKKETKMERMNKRKTKQTISRKFALTLKCYHRLKQSAHWRFESVLTGSA